MQGDIREILSISGKGCLAEKDLARGPVKESSETAQEATERAERLEEQGTARRGRRPRGGRRGRSEEVTLARGRPRGEVTQKPACYFKCMGYGNNDSLFQDRRRHLPQPPPTNSGHRSHSSGAAVLSDLREPTPDYDESIASKRSPRFELY